MRWGSTPWFFGSAMFLGLHVRAQDTMLPPPLPTTAEESAPVSTRELVERLRSMEQMNQKLLERVEKLSEQNETLTKQFQSVTKKVDESARKTEQNEKAEAKKKEESKDSGLAGPGGFKEPTAGQNLGTLSPSAIEESGARSSGARGIPYAQEKGNRNLGKIPLKTFFDYGRDGIGMETEDQEFLLKFRGEFQTDSLLFLNPGNAAQMHNGFYLPRTRYYFQGHITKPIDYQLSFQRSFTTFGFLNVFMNFNYNNGLQFRIGRFKVPYTYEWYKLNNWRLITPERSLFDLNFGLGRMDGAMIWGQLLDARAEYAVGIFDGPRNSQQDYNNSKDVAAFLNFKPFDQTDSPLKNVNIGGSVDYGNQNNPLQPAVLRTNVNASSETLSGTDPINNATVPFLAFNNNVRERGIRSLWDLHLAYYYGGFSLYADWGSGFNSFAPTNRRPVAVPVDGWAVTMAYLLTGETLNERTLVDPNHRFDLRPGKFGLGAFEPFLRYSTLDIGSRVFTGGLADPSLWTNRVGLVDAGMNWYLVRGVKIYFDWEHAMFAQPVYYRPGGLSLTNNLFWLRFQLYY